MIAAPTTSATESAWQRHEELARRAARAEVQFLLAHERMTDAYAAAEVARVRAESVSDAARKARKAARKAAR